MPLIRNEVYQYLLQCHEEEEVQEIVGAYVFSKYRAGNSDVQVLLKLQQLAQFLKFRGMDDFVSQYRDAIHCISCEVHHRAGGCIGSATPRTHLGVQAWQRARKPSGISILRPQSGRLDVDMTSEDASDGHFQGLGAVRRKGRVPFEDVDAVRCLPSYESCCDSDHVVHPLPPFYWSKPGNQWMAGTKVTKVTKPKTVNLSPPPYHPQHCTCNACASMIEP